jgi:hypothetical protein
MEINSSKLVSPIYAPLPKYDTGWVACSDWTNQLLGTAVGGNVIHNLNTDLADLDVKLLISTDGTDDNSLEARDYARVSAGDLTYGFTIYQVDGDELQIQTGVQGIGILTSGTGAGFGVDTESWYYRIIVTKREDAVPVRNISEDYSTLETDTGKNWIDGKRIYRKVINFGALPNAATKTVAHGIAAIDTMIPGFPLGTAYNATNYIPMNYVDGTYRISTYVDATNISVVTSVDMTAWTVSYVTLEFTK